MTHSIRSHRSDPFRPCPGVFVTATGTDVGKTLVSRGLVLGLRRRGIRIAAIKPLETGCVPCPKDAELLARASGAPELAHDPAWYRVAPSLAPYAVELSGLAAPPDVPAMLERTRAIAMHFDALLVEGAGGLLVPLDRTSSMADLARDFQLPLLLVADDRLGVLSHVLTAYEAAQRRDLPVLAVVLNRCGSSIDESMATNREILVERIECPVLSFPHVERDDDDDDDSIANATEESGLVALCCDAFSAASPRLRG